MGDIINLKRVRKRIARAEAEQNAAARRLQFGRSKIERQTEVALQRRREAALDGHKRLGEDEI